MNRLDFGMLLVVVVLAGLLGFWTGYEVGFSRGGSTARETVSAAAEDDGTPVVVRLQTVTSEHGHSGFRSEGASIADHTMPVGPGLASTTDHVVRARCVDITDEALDKLREVP